MAIRLDAGVNVRSVASGLPRLPRVIKSNGSRQPFDEAKLRSGILRAIEKRPVSLERVELTINRIKHRLRATGEPEVNTLSVGELVMDELRDLDDVAYVRFASVYRSFQDINEFREEIERLDAGKIKRDE